MNITRTSTAEMIAALLFPDLALRPLNERLAIVDEIESNLQDDLAYTGQYINALGEAYGQFGHNLPLETLVLINESIGRFDFFPLTMKPHQELSLREALTIFTAQQIEDIRLNITEADAQNVILDKLSELTHDMNHAMELTRDVVEIRIIELQDKKLPATPTEMREHITELMFSERGVLLESMIMFRDIADNAQFKTEVLEVMREGTVAYQKNLSFIQASTYEEQAKEVFRKASIVKLQQQYPRIHQLVNLDMVLNEFLSAVTDYADTTYKLDMDWTEYNVILANRYERERYAELASALKREVVDVYTRTVAMKAHLAASAVGNSVAGVSSRLARKFVMATRLDKLYRMSKGAFDVTANACRTINESIIQRGVRTVSAATEVVRGEVSNQAKKYSKWDNHESQGLIADAIIDELVGHENFDKWADQVENGQLDELHSAAINQTVVVCADVDEHGLAQLKKRKILANVEALQHELELALVNFSKNYGYVFEQVNALYEYGEVLKSNYEDTLMDDVLLEKEEVIHDLVHNVGLRIAHRFVATVMLTDEDKNYINMTIQNGYESARKNNEHYTVSEADFIKKIGGLKTFTDLKGTVPISTAYETTLHSDFATFISNELKKLPQKSEMTQDTLAIHRQTIERLLETLGKSAVEMTMRDGTVYKVTRSPHLWKTDSSDASKVQRLMDEDEKVIYEQLATNQATIRMLDLNKAHWIRVPYAIISSYRAVKSRITVPMFSQLYSQLMSRLLSEYKEIAAQQGFMLNQSSLKFENVMAFALHVVQTDEVHLHNVENVMAELTKQVITQSVTNVVFNDLDKKMTHDVIGKIKSQRQLNIDPSKVLQTISPEAFCDAKVLFSPQETQEVFTSLISKAIMQLEAPQEPKADNQNRLSIARQKAQEAVARITHYTPQDKEVFSHLVQYARQVQNEYIKAGKSEVLNVQVSAENHLVQIMFTDASEVFILHPQFIVNAISHKVYADRTGVMQFERAFTSEYDQSLGGDMGSLASLITARRKTDYASKPLSEQDATRMSRLHQFVTTYMNDMKEANLQFSFLKAPNGVIQCGRIYSNGKEVYQFNPMYMLDVVQNKFVFERENTGATLAELEAQFFNKKQTAHLNLQQMNILNNTFTLAYDLRRNLG